jgi:hypothetical protein
MKATQPNKTITLIFAEFLADQKARISHRTFLKYESIIDLYKGYLENYWPDLGGEYDKITKAGGTFCGTFGPESVTSGYSEFLGYYMPRKVMCGKETMQAAGTVTKKLAKWLSDKGYIGDTTDARERAGEAAKNLPKAREVLYLLEGYLVHDSLNRPSEEIRDHFCIERIEPGNSG